jgi:tetratricopeptide (TPR) repeat protein/tRNA A-37 threonylcarbamoyl transferase component Bud32
MRKILSAFLLFALSSAALPLMADEGAAVTVPADISGTEAASHDQAAPKPGGDDVAVFRNNTIDHPDVAAAALLRKVSTLPPEDVKAFREQNCDKIRELIRSLHRSSRESTISREEYNDFTLKFRDYGIYTMQGRVGGQPPNARMQGKKDPVEALVAVDIAAETGDNKKVAAALEDARTSYPDNAGVQVSVAVSYNADKNYKMAEKSATTAINIDSRNPDAYKARALARASLEDRKGAIEDIQKAMEIDPQDESAKVLSALLASRKAVPTLKSISSVEEIKRALGAVDEAPDAVAAGPAGDMGAVEAGKPAEPDYAKSKAYLQTAAAKNRLGDYESAAHYAGLAIEKDAGNISAYLERANAYNFLGRYDDAVRDASQVIDKDPANLQAFNMRAWALNRKGQARDAETDASRAIGLNPNFADAWFNRALAYEKQGDYKHMLEDFKQAASLSGSYSSRYQDAVAQYGQQVPGFAALPAGANRAIAAAEGTGAQHRRNPLSRFLVTLFFTLTGGALVAMGLIHIMTSKRDGEATARITHPDVLSPSIFYEGVATGKYKIERKLGQGAMGVVYEATDQSLGRKVAIKKMSDEIKVNEREKQRFLDEARTVALLHHPGIVEIHTIFEEDDNIYLVFEHVDGETVDRVLDREARIPFERARELFGEVAGALSYAHSKSVVHRDLKLSNMMLSSEGGVKVMDFGLARHAMESAARFSNKEVVGSPAYMAPEQELGVSSVESDIYSLGVCLYECLSGVLPFQGPDFHQQKMRLAYQQPSEMVAGLPKGVDAVVAKCLATEPGERFHSADEFRRALNAVA